MMLHAGQKETLDLEAGEVILVHKPSGWTSFDIVARLRSMFGIRKIGHAGTLDPKASGLLIVCTGAMTKKMTDFQDLEKEYTGVIELGVTTKSFDAETEVVERKEVHGVTSDMVEQVFASFTGPLKQLPPMYSAVKKHGRRLYKYARKGKDVQREPRDVFIHSFTMTSFESPLVGFNVVCSKGTYVRSLAHDSGQALGCGAYLKQLTRTRIGDYRLEDALPVERFHTIGPKLLQAVPV